MMVVVGKTGETTDDRKAKGGVYIPVEVIADVEDYLRAPERAALENSGTLHRGNRPCLV